MSFLILIGDLSQSAASTLFGRPINRRWLIAAIGIFCVFPLAMLRKVKSLRFTGFLAMGLVVFYLLAMSWTVLTAERPPVEHAAFHTSLPNFFRALPLAVFAVCCARMLKMPNIYILY